MQNCVNILTPKLLPTVLSQLRALLLGAAEGTHLLQSPSFMVSHTAASLAVRLKYLTMEKASWITGHKEEPASLMCFYLSYP